MNKEQVIQSIKEGIKGIGSTHSVVVYENSMFDVYLNTKELDDTNEKPSFSFSAGGALITSGAVWLDWATLNKLNALSQLIHKDFS